jgi:hypothetical protein
MTDYKNIFGKPVKFLATDPDNAEAEGQIWYNSTDGAFKTMLVNEAWSSGANLINIVAQSAGAGTQTAGLIAGGTSDNGATVNNNTEEYNGSGWSTGGTLNTATRLAWGAGSQTAAWRAGGVTPPGGTFSTAAEHYDGSSWTTSTAVGTARYNSGGAGLQNSKLIFGGESPGGASGITEEYNGTIWSTVNPLNTAIIQNRGAGEQTAALSFAGFLPPGPQTGTEQYDGSSWTTMSNLNTGRYTAGGSGSPYNNVTVFGGAAPSPIANAENWDGTSWTNVPSLASARRNPSNNIGTGSATISAGGSNPPTTNLSITEEYNRSANVITAGAWASGGNLNTGRASLGGAGSQTAALAFGGTVFTPATPGNPFKNESEEYNGTSWTEGNNLNQARSGIVGAGTQTAAIGAGGLPGSGASNTANSEEYDGTSWAEGNNLVNASYSRAGAGTQTATILMGGGSYTNPPPSSSRISNTEYYDGTSWSEQNDMNTARYVAAGCGSQTSSLVSGGISSTSTVTNVEEWNGTSWSEVNDLIVANYGHTLTGIQTAALQAAGNDGSVTAAAFNYNGTSWTTAPSVATARESLAGGDEGSTQTSSIVFGGAITPAPTGYQQTEEFTGETSALNIKTITTS